MDDKTRTELEAAAFRRLVAHLQERTDVQNIDLMNLAGFCRNCLSRWYREEAGKQGIEIADPEGPRDRLRHAVRRLEGQAPERSLGRPEEGLRQGPAQARLVLACRHSPAGAVPVIPIIHRIVVIEPTRCSRSYGPPVEIKE